MSKGKMSKKDEMSEGKMSKKFKCLKVKCRKS